MARPRDSSKRISTGIQGLDKLLEGGFIPGTSVVLSGGAGSGKTTFSLQFLWDGLKNDETCMYVTFEESEEDIITDAAEYGMDLEPYIKKKKLIIKFIKPYEMRRGKSSMVDKTSEIIGSIVNDVSINKASRLVIDSLSILSMATSDISEVRTYIFELIDSLRKYSCTTILIEEMVQGQTGISRSGVSEFVSDGVIALHSVGLGTASFHSIQILKMRRTNHGKDLVPISISRDTGMVIKKSSF